MCGMTLTDDARRLLRLIADSPGPVAASDFFHQVVPPLSGGLEDGLPEQEAWAARRIGLYEAYVTLWRRGLVRVVHPANGRRPDLVEVTDAGRNVLAG